ncbi:MAG: transglycosylase SLT domain-containing protein [Paludibacter sp.]|nr:transglycosylase SLT domain-containing protein [Paludibacter sp.]
MIYQEYVKTNKVAFLEKVKSISFKLSIDPDWLMVVMYAESRLNEKALNANGGASGLIQFMPSTVKPWRVTTEYLRSLSNVEQLDYVYKYFQGYAGKIKSVFDLYKVTFFPIMLGKASDWILQSTTLTAATVANANKIIDLNGDKKITVAEFEQYVAKYLKKKAV